MEVAKAKMACVGATVEKLHQWGMNRVEGKPQGQPLTLYRLNPCDETKTNNR